MYSLKELLDDHQTGHSEFQDDYLITVKAGGTLYGQYKQALRELYRRVRGLRELTCDKEILEIEIEELSFTENADTEYEKRKKKVEYRRKTMQMEECNRVIENTEREAIRFYQQACALKAKIGDLTPEKRAKLDKEMWLYRIKGMLALDIAVTGRPSKGTYEIMAALPEIMKIYLAQELKASKEEKKPLIDWVLNKSTETSVVENLPQIEERKFLEEVNQCL